MVIVSAAAAVNPISMVRDGCCSVLLVGGLMLWLLSQTFRDCLMRSSLDIVLMIRGGNHEASGDRAEPGSHEFDGV